MSDLISELILKYKVFQSTTDKQVLGFEKWETERQPYLALLPVYWIITVWVMTKKGLMKVFGRQPKTNSLWFDGLGPTCRGIKDGVASWRALDLIYNHTRTGNPIDDFWVNMLNAQAVRNRLKMVKSQLFDIGYKVGQEQSEVRIMSLASGSAQAVIEVLALLKQMGIPGRAFLIDREQAALDNARKLATQHGIQIDTARTSVSRVKKHAEEFKPQIIEMVGFMDYLPHPKAVKLTRLIHDSLPTKGWYLTANVAPNPERWFLYWVINWAMIYRNPEELAQVVTEGGFEKHLTLMEPLQIHTVVTARK